MRRASETLARGQTEQRRQTLEKVMRAYPPEDLRRINELAAQTYSRPDVRQMIDQLARVRSLAGFEQYASAADLGAAAERFEQQLDEAGDLPEHDSGMSRGWWLATRCPQVQFALLYAGLEVLDAFSALLEEAAGVEIPDSAQAGAKLCLAIVAFLIVWIGFTRDARSDYRST